MRLVYGKSQLEIVVQAISQVQETGTDLQAVVLNRFEFEKFSRCNIDGPSPCDPLGQRTERVDGRVHVLGVPVFQEGEQGCPK